MPIRVLDKSVAELIAAGEVIERPASVVKELIENSIDAGAKSVTVEIKNGGITFLRVSDDGTGIPFEECPVAFLRHATSKVSTGDDLTAISTLGFRGEALASVAAVSRVSLITKTRGEETGTSYKIEGGAETEYAGAGCPDGTTVVIRDLFFNTPARLKFLKKDVSEGNYVQSAVEKAALINPGVSFKFIRDNKIIKVTPGDGKLYSSIYAIFGKSFATGMVPADFSQNGAGVSGYISAPLFCRSNRSYQNFYVNSRYIRSLTCAAALEEGYRNSVMSGKFPACVLNISILPADVDANVHPAKTEVRFADDRAVFDAVYLSVRNALLNSSRNVPEAKNPEFPRETAFAGEFRDIFKSAGAGKTYGFNSPAAEYAPAVTGRQAPDTSGFKHLTGEAFVKKEKPPANANALIEYGDERTKVIGEAFDAYIICERGDGVVFIDKHAADERLRFDKMKLELANHSQLLIESVKVRLDAEGYSALMDASGELAEVGVEINGGDGADFTVGVAAFPALLNPGETAGIVSEIAELLKKGANADADRLGLFDEVLHAVACKAAIKAGDKTVPRDLEQLARRVLDDGGPRYCPHGRPIAVTVTKRDFEKMFKRIP
ncbi:MAG: DNA mismatch repair endonuclease MutL [Oscillospiraceae bacterium]|jgi:DNA mismatch repair protein MutL|nr:DNA mismatch repair endonuclease MutL [Oscillospiraceae bacterium]